MTMIPNTAVIAAAAEQQRRNEEENSSPNVTSDWEFKFLRMQFGFKSFDNQETLQTALKEEAANGWELVEKFDGYRIRLRRKIANRQNDGKSAINPYRSSYGISGSLFTLIIIFLSLGLPFIIFLGMVFFITIFSRF